MGWESTGKRGRGTVIGRPRERIQARMGDSLVPGGVESELCTREEGGGEYQGATGLQGELTWLRLSASHGSASPDGDSRWKHTPGRNQGRGKVR